MSQRDRDAELVRARDLAHEEGREQGRAEIRPFSGVAGVSFPTTLPVHQAVRSYERLLLDAEPHVLGRARGQDLDDRDLVAGLEDRLGEVGQQLAAVPARVPARTPRSWLRRLLDRNELERRRHALRDQLDRHLERREQAQRDRVALEEELAAVRAWLDQWVEDATSYAPDRVWLRRPLASPPSWVRTYPSSADFLAEDPRRANTGSARRHDTGGSDHGHRWTWSDPARPGAGAMYWRVSWLPSTGEIYAVRRAGRDNGAPWSGGHGDPEPVWLLASLPPAQGDGGLGDPVSKHLRSLEHLSTVPRESLLVLVDALAATDWTSVLRGQPSLT